jgi:hypothetical protein
MTSWRTASARGLSARVALRIMAPVHLCRARLHKPRRRRLSHRQAHTATPDDFIQDLRQRVPGSSCSPHCGAGRAGDDQHQPCRAQQFVASHGVATLHAVDQRFQQKAGEPRGGGQPVRRPLQLVPRSRGPSDHASSRTRDCGSRLVDWRTAGCCACSCAAAVN